MKIMSGAYVSEENYKLVETLGEIFTGALQATNSGVFYHHNISQLLWGYKDNFLNQTQKQSKQLPPSWSKSLKITFPSNLTTTIQLQVYMIFLSSLLNLLVYLPISHFMMALP